GAATFSPWSGRARTPARFSAGWRGSRQAAPRRRETRDWESAMSALAWKTIAIIGFGEAGGILGAELAKRNVSVRAYDLLLDDPAAREAMRAKAKAAKVEAAASHAEAARGADLVI